MKLKTLGMAGAAGIAVVLVLGWAFAPRPQRVDIGVVDRGVFETAIEEEARTRLRERYTVTAPVAGRLLRPTLRVGDTVGEGQDVARISASPAPMLDARTRAQLSARVQAAEAAVARADAGLAAASVAMERAEAEHRRSQRLLAQGYVASARAEADRLAAQAAQRERDAAEFGRRVAQHELVQARAALQIGAPSGQAQAVLELTAPVDARVLRVFQSSETTVAPGTALLELGDLGRLEVVAELLTTDALRASAGSVVHIGDWGGEGELQGLVRSVEPSAFRKVSALGVEEQRVNVLIDLTSPRQAWMALGDGFRVGVRIVTRREPDALRVPVSAVFPREQGEGLAVFVVEDGRAARRDVRLGGRNDRHAWVLDGLDEGQTVIVYPPATLTDGERVRGRDAQ